MYNRGKILVGIALFVILFTSPVWYSLATGSSHYYPDPEIITKDVPGMDKCVMSADYMRAAHMDLLNQWRDNVVRQGLRLHTSPDGKKYNMSLSNTCMKCHSNKVQFCDKCHNYMAVGQPDCWNCHVEPKEGR